MLCHSGAYMPIEEALNAAGDMESEKCHLSGIIIRDLSCTVSNYRSTKTLDQYLKEQNVLGGRSLSSLNSRCLQTCSTSATLYHQAAAEVLMTSDGAATYAAVDWLGLAANTCSCQILKGHVIMQALLMWTPGR